MAVLFILWGGGHIDLGAGNPGGYTVVGAGAAAKGIIERCTEARMY